MYCLPSFRTGRVQSGMHYRLANREAWAAFDLIQPLGLRVHVTHRTHDAMRLKASVGERTLARIGKSLQNSFVPSAQ